MARIVDKDTRLIDIDFGPVFIAMTRTAGSFAPTSITFGQNGVDQILGYSDTPSGSNLAGSFIQYSQIDLSHMTLNHEVMQPVEVSVQRTSPVPLGSHVNGNNFDQIEEYIFVFSRPLNNAGITFPNTPNFESFRNVGLDRSTGASAANAPTHQQTIYAEKRMYSYTSQTAATVTNGELQPPPANVAYNSIYGMPSLDSVTTWGTMSAITGPQLHCYRVVIMRNQGFSILDPALWTNVPFDGTTSLNWPPVNITFLAKDPNYTEGEYLTRLSNAMNNIPINGDTA